MERPAQPGAGQGARAAGWGPGASCPPASPVRGPGLVQWRWAHTEAGTSALLREGGASSRGRGDARAGRAELSLGGRTSACRRTRVCVCWLLGRRAADPRTRCQAPASCSFSESRARARAWWRRPCFWVAAAAGPGERGPGPGRWVRRRRRRRGVRSDRAGPFPTPERSLRERVT